jgi:hypothetical protein
MQIATQPVIAAPAYPVGILRMNGRFHVLSGQAIPKGACILRLEGHPSALPTRYSVQVGWQEHVETWVPLVEEASLDSCQVRYMNHSCQPNTRFADRQVIALRDIAAHEELTFDYNTTEWEMAEAFQCECGHCGGRTIAGFRHLSPTEQRGRRDRLPEYLRSRIQ